MGRSRTDRDPETIVFDRLEEEFGDGVDPVLLREIAREEVEGFESARVRDFVPIIAWRQARARVILHLRATGVVELDVHRHRRLG